MQPVHPKEFLARWSEWYPDTVPRGWAMFPEYPSRWLRIHSLPLGKRYPESEEEQRELLARHNVVLDAIIGSDECCLLGFDYDGVYHLPPHHLLREWLPDAPPVMRIESDDDEDSDPVSVFAGIGAWHRGMFDTPSRLVADDRLELVVLNWNTGAAYAPYDGGADLFWSTEVERDLARVQFVDWLSTNPSGL